MKDFETMKVNKEQYWALYNETWKEARRLAESGKDNAALTSKLQWLQSIAPPEFSK